MAIDWMYREDYGRAGYLVLPLNERREQYVVWQSLGVSLALVPLSLIPVMNGEAGLVYPVGALLLDLMFIYYVDALPFIGRTSRRDICSLLRSLIFPQY